MSAPPDSTTTTTTTTTTSQPARASRRPPAAAPAPEAPLRVLALTHRVPFPPDKGDKIRTFHLLTRLAKRAEVHLVCFADPPEDARHAARMREAFASVTIVPLDVRAQKLRALPYLLTARPLTLPVFHRPELERAVDDAVAAHRPAVMYAESSSMAPYALRHPRVPLVMDFVDVDSAKWRACAAKGNPASRLVHLREALTLARYERHVAERAAVSVLTAAREVALLRGIAPRSPAQVLENGVDTDYFAPRASHPETPSLVFAGAMDYIANVEAAVYLVEAVLPRVRERYPDATVTLAGSRPSREVQALARVPGVTVTGFVEDIRVPVQRAAVSVCPLRVARGVQNKVLEAMAMGVPIVASPAAAEGIDAQDGRHFVVARDGADGREFADAVCALLADRARMASLARSARERVVERYGWDPRADELHALLRDAARRAT